MRNSTMLNWDELNLLRASAVDLVSEYKRQKDKEKVRRWCDYMEFVLCLVYAYGWEDAEEIVGIVPFKDGLDDKTVNLEIEGETYRERIFQQLEEDSLLGILRIIDTEAHRDYNAGVYDAAKKSGVKVRKKWMTMMDERVRDTHSYLEGVEVGLDDRFYTFDGDSAMYPGDFSLVQNNANCRCGIVLVR